MPITLLRIDWRVEVRLDHKVTHWGAFTSSESAIAYYESLAIHGSRKLLQVKERSSGKRFATILDEDM